MRLPGWRFGDEDKLQGSSRPSILDFFCLCSVLVLTICAVSGRVVIGVPLLHGLLGGIALGWGVVATIHSLVKSYTIPGEDFFVGVCLGLTFAGHALLSGAPVSGGFSWAILAIANLAGCAFLARMWIRRWLIARMGP